MSRRNKRRRRIIRLGIAGVVLAAVLVVVFLFRIDRDAVVVYGNTYHTSEEIVSGLVNDALTENTLYFLWHYRDGEIPDSIPFLSSLHVQMKSWSGVEVQVTEKEPVAYVDKGGYVYIDNEGTVVQICDEVYAGVPIVTGASVGEVNLYQKLATESSAQLRTILSLTQLLSYQELTAKEIRFGENMDITVFIDTVQIQLGQDEYLEEKVANLKKILLNLEGQSGTLHMESFTGKGETVAFSPSETPDITVDVNSVSAGSIKSGTSGDGGDDGSADPNESTGSGDASGGDTGEGTGDGAVEDGADAENSGDEGSADEDTPEDTQESVTIAMVFNSSGTLVYNVHVENGVVVDSGGSPVDGVTIDAEGYIVDAYMNRFDPTTGELVQ